MTQNSTILHGTAVTLKLKNGVHVAVFLRGPSGSGKSDLALRLIEGGAELVCDDQVFLEQRHGKIFAHSVDAIRGPLEVRGVGLLHYPVGDPAQVVVVIDLAARDAVPRLPEEKWTDILGVKLPQMTLHAFDASTPAKVRFAAEVAVNPKLVVR